MFYITALSIWLSIHLYVGSRIIPPMNLATGPKILAWGLVLLAFSLIPLTFTLSTEGPKPFWYRPLFWLTFILFGYVTTLFPLLMVKDAMMWSWGKFGSYAAVSNQEGSVGTTMAGHDTKVSATHQLNLGILAITAALLVLGMREANSAPTVQRVDVPIKGLANGLDGFKIALISDIHISQTVHGDTVEDIVRRVNALEPDMVAHTGDLADGFITEMAKDAAPLANLKSKHGTYYVTGNHEYYWDLIGWLSVVRKTGAVILNNENRMVEHNGARLLVAGVTDYSAGMAFPNHKSDPAKALAGAPQRDFTLMLAHQPRSVVAVSATGKVDLQLSGHSHGGQYFPWNFLVRLFHPVNPGLHKYNGMWVYLTRGTVYWGPPLRLGAPKEISLITLKNAG